MFLQSSLQCCDDAGDKSGAGLFDPALRGDGHPLAPSLGVRTHGVDHFQRTEVWVRHPGDYVADAGTDDNAVVVVAVAVDVAVDDVAAVASADGFGGGDHTSLWWLLLLGPVSCCCCCEQVKLLTL